MSFPLSASTLCILLALLLVGCGGSDGADHASSNASSESPYNATLMGTVGESSYEVPVNCVGLEEDYFTFKSDRSDASDTNGDGYSISGMRMGDKLIFTVIDHDTTWSTPNLGTWNIDGETVTGSGQVYEDGGEGRTREASFTVEC